MCFSLIPKLSPTAWCPEAGRWWGKFMSPGALSTLWGHWLKSLMIFTSQFSTLGEPSFPKRNNVSSHVRWRRICLWTVLWLLSYQIGLPWSPSLMWHTLKPAVLYMILYLPILTYIRICLMHLISCTFSTMNVRLIRAGILPSLSNATQKLF